MPTLALALILLVAALHTVFFVFESVLWTTPGVRRRFGQTEASAETTRVLALNQGAYNLGLAVLLAWAALTSRGDLAQALLLYVIAMGVVGGATAKRSILLIQAAPALAALAALRFA